MTSESLSTLSFIRAFVVGASLCLAPAGFSQVSVETAFTESLVASEQAASGLSKLTTDQRNELDRQITKELTLAREGDVSGFATTFTQRRTEKQQKEAGLDQLTSDERASLDAVIARTMAIPRRRGTVARATAIDTIETVRDRAKVHGEVGMTVGMASGGRSFYGGNMSVVYEDPNSGVTTAVSYSQYRGDGIFFDGRSGYGWGGYYRPGFRGGICR